MSLFLNTPHFEQKYLNIFYLKRKFNRAVEKKRFKIIKCNSHIFILVLFHSGIFFTALELQKMQNVYHAQKNFKG